MPEEKRLKRLGNCPSCQTPIYGSEDSTKIHCWNCGAEIDMEAGKAVPGTKALENAVERVLTRHGLIVDKKSKKEREPEDWI